LEKANEKNPMGKRYYKHLYAVSLIAAGRDSELLKKYAADGIKEDIKEAEKEYTDVAKAKKLDIKRVVAANVERLASGDAQHYRAMKERVHAAYKISK
jgi:precorrin-4 methylase